MSEEFKLSEKVFREKEWIGRDCVLIEDVKEFIRILKEGIKECERCKEYPQVTAWIDKLAGFLEEDLK